MHPDLARQAGAVPSRAARFITHLTDPALVLGVLLVLVTWRGAGSATQALGWLFIVLVLVIVLPNLVILAMMRTGQVSDFRLVVQEHRLIPSLVAVAGLLVSVALLALMNGPEPLLALLLAVLAGTVLGTATTHWTKVSAHAAMAAAAAIEVGVLFGAGPGIGAGLLAVAAAWSRVRLGRHSTAQVLLGLLLGVVVAVGAVVVARSF